ncbi:MAG: adenosylcobinamide-GDP ribazoletransferase [Clostridia bacterium]|nr:adenosylcobinamide-GDP ribazoletransferase [Clostridia bacterium]
MRLIRSFLIAFSTYSRIPVPQVEWTEENRRYAMCFFPLVGAVLGLVLWGWLALCDALRFGAFLRGAAAALIPLLVTGGIHMDGYMDVIDALASWQPKEKRLEILKDSHAGAFAVMGCAGYLLLSAALFSEAQTADGLKLLCVFVLSRVLSALALTIFRNARPQGMLDDFSRTAQKRMILVSGGIYAAACLIIWGLTGGWLVLLCPMAAALCLLYYRHMAYKQFGGVTGDLAGWFLQVTELVLTAVIVMGGKLL